MHWRRGQAFESSRAVSGAAVLAVAVPALIFLQILFYGADRLEVALLAALAELVLLSAALLASRAVQGVIAGRRDLGPLYLLFAALVGWGLFQLAPFPQGMGRDAWASAAAFPAVTIDRFATVAELVKLCGLAAVFLLGVGIGHDPHRSRVCLLTLAILAGLYSAGAVVHFHLLGPPEEGRGPARLAATLLNPNNTSALLSVFAVAGLTMALCALRGSAWAKVRARAAADLGPVVLPAALAVLALWAASLTGSRGGAFAGVVGLATAAALVLLRRMSDGHSAKTPIVVAWLVAALLAGGVVILFLGGGMQERMLAAPDGVADRQANIELYLSRLPNVPWTGFGLGTFQRFNDVIVGSSDATKLWQFGAMHNVLLQWVYEGGWPGAALMFACIAYVLAHILRRLNRGVLQPWPIIALGSSAVLLTHGLVDFDLQVPAIAALWALALGAGFGASRGQGSAEASRSRRVRRAFRTASQPSRSSPAPN